MPANQEEATAEQFLARIFASVRSTVEMGQLR